jgi:glycogen synthase
MSIFFSKQPQSSYETLFSVDASTDEWKELKPILAKVFLKFLACSCTSYGNDEGWSTPFGLRLVKPWEEQVLLDYFPWGVRPHDYCYFAAETGLKVSVLENEEEVIFAFGAHNSGATELPSEKRIEVADKQVDTIKENLRGGTPYLYSQAAQLIKDLMTLPRFKNKKPHLCGQSFGGSIAAYVGLSLRMNAYCLNAIMLGNGLLQKVPSKNLKEANQYIFVVSAIDDFASHWCDSVGLYQLGAALLGLPRHVGSKYAFPSPYDSMVDRHVYMMGGVMHYLGYSSRTRTSELPPHDIIPHMLDEKQMKEKFSSASSFLKQILSSFNNTQLKQILQKIKAEHAELYGFLCFSVWWALGKKDCGQINWGEQQLLGNPQVLHTLANSQGKLLLKELISHYQQLNTILRVIPEVEDLSSKEALALIAKSVSDVVRTQYGIENFQIEADQVVPWMRKLRLFLFDQLKSHLREEMQRIVASKKSREHSVVAKKDLLATRFPKVCHPHLRVLAVSVEFLKVLKVGGLAEAAHGISLGLTKQGHRVTLVFPKFERFPHDQTGAVAASIKDTNTKIQHHFKTPREDRLFQGEVDTMPAFFIEHTCLNAKEKDRFHLGSKGIYQIEGDNIHAEQLKERFAYFASALTELIYQRRGDFDLVMFHDWHGALTLHLLVKRHFTAWMQREIPPLVYVFHNNGYAAQGVLDYNSKKLFEKLELNTQHLNVMQESLRFADHCCTVSPTYAQEVQGLEGNGLGHFMRKAAKNNKLTGILNGANSNAYNPETDPQLVNWIDPQTGKKCPLHLGPGDTLSSCKGKAKVQLQKWIAKHHPKWIDQFGVDVTREKVVTFVGRLDSSQKGLEKLRQAMYAAKEKGAAFIVMGCYSSENDASAQKIIAELQKEAERLKGKDWGGALLLIDRVNALGKYDLQQGTVEGIPGIGSLVRFITTFGFFPSKYEPCGSVQYEAWAFGSLVITTAVGGFADTVVSSRADPLFNGFTCPRIEDWDSEDQDRLIREKVSQALEFWDGLKEKEKQALMSRLMQQTRLSGWNSSTSPQGISSIAQYERVLGEAEQRSFQRVSIESIDFKSFS